MTSSDTCDKRVMYFQSSKPGTKFIAASSRVISFWIISLSCAGTCMASCESTSFGSNSSGQFVLPTYHGYLVDDICRWTLEPTLDDYVVHIAFKEIDLSVSEGTLTSRCAAAVIINGERLYCHRKDSFCLIYATSEKCIDVLSDYPFCLRRNQTIPKLELEFDAYFYDERSQKFNAEYKVLNCNYEPTTTMQNFPTRINMGQIKDRSKDSVITSTPSTPSSTRDATSMELIVILLPIAIAILIALVMAIWCRCRKKRTFQDEKSDVDDNSIGATKNTMANVAYESWNPPTDNRPKLPERTHPVTRNLSIPVVTIPGDEYSDFNIYEAIPSAPPSVITPRFTEFGQRYFEIGFNNRSENVYERSDSRNVENQSPYDMAVPDPVEFVI